VWVLPGGGVEPHEDPKAAAIREVLEETGITVEVTRLAAHYHPVNRLAKDTYLFLCRPVSGTLGLSYETADVGYFPLDALPASLFLIHRGWIAECLAAHGKVIDRSLTEVSYGAFLCHICRHPLIVLKFLWTRLFYR